MAVHNAKLTMDDGEVFLFASIDGDEWLGVNRPLREGEEDDFQKLLDGDGNFMPMRIGRRWLDHAGHRPGWALVIEPDPNPDH